MPLFVIHLLMWPLKYGHLRQAGNLSRGQQTLVVKSSKGRSGPTLNYIIIMCIDDNAVINNKYGKHRNLIFLYKICLGTRKDFFEVLYTIWARALKELRQPGSRILILAFFTRIGSSAPRFNP